MEAVECRSDSEYAERPVAFLWEGEKLVVARIIDRRLTPQGKSFMVTTASGRFFTLEYDQAQDIWTVSPR